jgi:Na+-driven multidrug efflux pump
MSLATGPFALFEGVGNTSLEMWAGILENLVIKIGLSALFSRFFGLYGYWLGASLSAFTSPIVGVIYYLSRRWEKRTVSLPTDGENKV